jgi:hypothetical protein
MLPFWATFSKNYPGLQKVAKMLKFCPIWSHCTIYHAKYSFALWNKSEWCNQGPMLKNFLQPQFTNVCNKLACFSLANLSSIVECLMLWLEPTLVKHLSGAQLSDRLLALFAIIRLGWISLLVINTLAYSENS